MEQLNDSLFLLPQRCKRWGLLGEGKMEQLNDSLFLLPQRCKRWGLLGEVF
jgi:hypothetical protein